MQLYNPFKIHVYESAPSTYKIRKYDFVFGFLYLLDEWKPVFNAFSGSGTDLNHLFVTKNSICHHTSCSLLEAISIAFRLRSEEAELKNIKKFKPKVVWPSDKPGYRPPTV